MPRISKNNKGQGFKEDKAKFPDGLRPYRFHGLELSWKQGDENAKATCPFCGKVRKFSIEADTGKARCWSCGEGSGKGGMNPLIFIRKLYEHSTDSTNELYQLSRNKLIDESTLKEWGIVKSMITDEFMVPAFNTEKRLSQLYLFKRVGGSGGVKQRLLLTPTLGHKIFGLNLWDSSKDFVFMTEGPWDAAKLWETMSRLMLDEHEQIVECATIARSLLNNANVIGVPGANVFKPEWVPFFRGKTINLCFDADGAGLKGMQRVAGLLSKVTKDINYLEWGGDYKIGTDIRDMLTLPTSKVRDL